ncbi:hypothetical protein L198_00194 [Cryptococcus wingfieldii CBS 7118]|uniref:Uncharacterized protein n=1 Tax=Cryptococcus wingfieldii CBS 7118 TaxID=1295528 RepID=A0A1E3K5L0_9TREE|nr:hypothetical protein L198_00194 [Cryptococcus wingfieldii CBS 7118]ODO08464.1 hypothetical protein L198_00194 [Cryptococcus wingfieldii CBS 7118]
MSNTYLFALLFLLLPISFAQQAGNFSLKLSTSSSSCIILSQLTIPSADSPVTLQASIPICSDSSPLADDGSGERNVTWPLAEEGSSAASSLAIYGNIDKGDGDLVEAGCVMELSIDQVQYLLGRDLSWNPQDQLWDNGGDGYVMNGTTGGTLTCSDAVATLLPANAQLPNPYRVSADDDAWSTAITLDTSSDSPISASESSSESSASSETTSSSSTSAQISRTTVTSSSTASSAESSATDDGSGESGTSSSAQQSTASSSAISTSSYSSSTSEQNELTVKTSQTSSSFDAASITSSDIVGVEASSIASSSSSVLSSSSSSSTETVPTSASTTLPSSTQKAVTTTAPSTSASSNSDGSCVPVTITQVQTVTVSAGSERRWWMYRD